MRRNVFTLASDELEREVIPMWLSAGYRLSTIERRISDKRRIYRRLGRTERQSQIARKLTFENVRRIAQYEARCRTGGQEAQRTSHNGISTRMGGCTARTGQARPRLDTEGAPRL